MERPAHDPDPASALTRIRSHGLDVWSLRVRSQLADDAYIIALWVSRNGGRSTIEELRVIAERGVTALLLKEISFHELRHAALECWHAAVEARPEHEALAAGVLRGIVEGPTLRGRPPMRRDEDLIVLAHLYVEALQRDRRHVWDCVEQLLEERLQDARQRARYLWLAESERFRLQALVRECRRRGILSAASIGKASGELTDHGHRLLEENG